MLVVLYESALGYTLFDVKQFEDVGQAIPHVEAAIASGSKFKKDVKLRSFQAYVDAKECLENSQALIDGQMTELLEEFLEKNNVHQEKDLELGVQCPLLGASIKEKLDVAVTHTGVIPKLVRGIKTFLEQYLNMDGKRRLHAERGLGHAISRGKVQYNANRIDNMIIQGIAANDQLDKDINVYIMRLREWYSHHFPELNEIVDDHNQYARIVKLVQDKKNIDEEMLPQIQEIVMDDDKADDIIKSSKISMGSDINLTDLENITMFADTVIRLTDYRKSMNKYLHQSVENVAPNTGAILGDTLTARLISKAGSLTNLAKLPSCSVQILGAEKALFRAIKTKSATPKFGLLFHASHLGKAATQDKGKISRCLANKVAMAAKIDCFSEVLTNKFGESLNQQVQDRLNFYETGEAPPKSEDVMSVAADAHASALRALKGVKRALEEEPEEKTEEKAKKKAKKDKKKKSISETELAAYSSDIEKKFNGAKQEENEEEPAKKKKKKKSKRDANGEESALVEEVERNEEEEEQEENGEEPVKKKKKKKSKKEANEEESALVEEVEGNEEEEVSVKKKKKKDKRKSMAALEEASEEKPEKKKKKRESV